MSHHLASRIAVPFVTAVSLTFQASASQDKPLAFTENKGQWDERVLFKAEGAGGLTWFIERDGFTVLFSSSPTSFEGEVGGGGSEFFLFMHDPLNHLDPYRNRDERFDPSESNPPFNRSGGGVRSHALKFKFQNALPRTAGNFLPEQTTPASAASVDPTERLFWNNNYFLGNDESNWAPNCGNFQRVVLKDVWQGVDVVWRGGASAVTAPPVTDKLDDERLSDRHRRGSDGGCEKKGSDGGCEGMIEFDFLIHPGADASQIRVECLGLTGDLEATADGGELLLPTSLGILRQALPEAFQIEPDGQMQEVKAEFKVKGGTSFGVALPEGHDPAKPLVVDPLVYSTYLGGGGWEYINAVVPDEAGGVVIAGRTRSDNFPTTEGAYERVFKGNYDAFAAHLSEDGSELLYSTYFGGADYDWARALVSDGAGGMVVAGFTRSNSFPTTEGAFDRSQNGDSTWDAFVAHLSGDGSELLYSTYLGGESYDLATALAQDGVNGVVVTGYTYSRDFPTTERAFDVSFNDSSDVFITRLSMDGSELLYSTYLGGGGYDEPYALAPDETGGVVVAGFTASDDFSTTPGAFDRSFNGEWDTFIASLSGDGSELLYSTYLGGSDVEGAIAIGTDGAGGMVIAGRTYSDDFPTSEGAYDRLFNGGADAFAVRLSRDGSQLLYSTYLGGSGSDDARALAPDWAGGAVITGMTWSNDFPTIDGAFDRSHNDSCDAFVAWLNGDGSELLYSTYLGGRYYDYTLAATPDGAGGVVVAGFSGSDNFPTTEGAFDRSHNGGDDAFVTRIDIGLPSAVDDHSQSALPTECYLAEPYPNPFNATAHIAFSLPAASSVSIRVFDIAGREVASLLNGECKAGSHSATWNAEGFAAGLYIVKMEAGTFSSSRKVTLLK